jgi:hypothetical protein
LLSCKGKVKTDPRKSKTLENTNTEPRMVDYSASTIHQAKIDNNLFGEWVKYTTNFFQVCFSAWLIFMIYLSNDASLEPLTTFGVSLTLTPNHIYGSKISKTSIFTPDDNFPAKSIAPRVTFER